MRGRFCLASKGQFPSLKSGCIQRPIWLGSTQPELGRSGHLMNCSLRRCPSWRRITSAFYKGQVKYSSFLSHLSQCPLKSQWLIVDIKLGICVCLHKSKIPTCICFFSPNVIRFTCTFCASKLLWNPGAIPKQ